MYNNLVHYPGLVEPTPALNLADQSKRDTHSILADAMFVDPDKGDFRVKDGSPALKLGFVNFPMDQCGVTKPWLKALARTPIIPKLSKPDQPTTKVQFVKPVNYPWQAAVRDIVGLGERSAYGLPDEFDCAATSIRQTAGKPLDRYRWLVWAVTPVTYDGGSTTSIAELQVLPASAP